MGYTIDRARKDAYNRDKGTRRLEKAYSRRTLTKDNIKKRGYNKFPKMEGDVKVTINYEKIDADAQWDGLKGYLTNTDVPVSEVYAAYHNLWHVERAFRISKSKIEISPMFHFTHRRIEAHVCICFVALKVYKELERLLKLSYINMSVDKVLAMAQTIVTIQMTLPQNKKNHQSNHAHETTSTHRPFVRRRILGDTLTKSGKSIGIRIKYLFIYAGV